MDKKRTPAYLVIEKHLHSLIAAGRGRDEPLPAEPELATRFNVSRMTARQAYQRLASAGLIVRRRGVGSFVANTYTEELPVTGTPDFSSWIAGKGTTRRIHSYRLVAAPPEVARAMRLEPGTKVAYLHREREVGGVLSIDTRYLPAELYGEVSRTDLERESILKLLAGVGFHIVSGQLEINAYSANTEEAKRLGIKAGHPVLERRLSYSDSGGRCVLLGSSRYPAGGAYTFRFQFQTGTGPSTPAR